VLGLINFDLLKGIWIFPVGTHAGMHWVLSLLVPNWLADADKSGNWILMVALS
jgi:hypothetical protein